MAGSNTVVNTNIMALNTHRSLTNVGNKQAKASERLSSGLRINSAADDAAGLAISEKMRAQIRGLDMASKNSQDAISLIQTAEGGMQEIDNMLQRIRELVVQASNDTNDQESGDRTRIQEEINQLVEEIDSMSTRVEFNKKKVISGDFSDGVTKDLVDIRTYQPVDTSGSSSSTDTSTVKEITREDREAAWNLIKNMVADSGYDYDAIFDAYNLNDLDGSGLDLTTSAIMSDFSTAIDDILQIRPTLLKDTDVKDALDKLNVIRDAVGSASGGDVTAFLKNLDKIEEVLTTAYESIQEPTVLPNMPLAATGDAASIGASLKALVGAAATVVIATDDLKAGSAEVKLTDLLYDAIYSDYKNTRAAWDDILAATTKEEMETAWNDFYTALTEEVEKYGVDVVEATGTGGTKILKGSVDIDFAGNKSLTTALGQYLADKLDAYEAPEVDAKKGKPSQLATDYDALLSTVVSTGVALKDILTDISYANAFTDTRYTWEALRSAETVEDMQTAWNDFVTAFDNEMTAEFKDEAFDFTNYPTFDLATLKDNFVTYFNDKLAALVKEPAAPVDVQTNTLFFQVGANANQKLEININAINTKALGIGNGEGESWIDIDKFSGKSTTDLLTGLDDAISYVTVERSKLGAAQNRLEYTIKSLDISSENLSSAESRIRDTDMAKEMMNYTQANVLQQAAISMLAQANQQPQNLLSLLR